MPFWYPAVTSAEIVVGLSLLYFRFFLYETEEGTLQNFLVDLWIKIDTKSAIAKTRSEQLLRETLRLSSVFLSRVFGERFISVRSIFTSYCLAAASICILGALEPSSSIGKAGLLLMASGLIVIALEPAMSETGARLKRNVVIGLIYLAFVGYVIVDATLLDASPANNASLYGLLCVPIADALFVAANREIIRRALASERMTTLVAAIAISCFGLGALIAYETETLGPGMTFFKAMMATRYFIGATFFVQGAILLGLLAHRIIWPLLGRIVYAAERYKLFKERKLFGTIGTALLLHAVGAGDWIIDLAGDLGLE